MAFKLPACSRSCWDMSFSRFYTHCLFANIFWLMPLLVRLHFGSEDPHWKDWQTTAVTAAIPTFLLTSLFWAELLRRIKLRTYLLIFWLSAAFPLGCVGFAQTYWQFLTCHMIAAAGAASWNPVLGKLLKHFYPDSVRGRMFGILNLVTHGSSVAAVYAVGKWMETHPEAFRIFFPAAGLVQLVGIALLIRLARLTGARDGVAEKTNGSWAALFQPVLRMGTILRSDRIFLRYEMAFMTYGAAFMCCDALLPVLATDKLGMRYEAYAHSTQMVAKLAMLALTVPAGWLLDRLGPIRTSGLSFGILAFYPLLLLAADGPGGVGLASMTFGMGLSGVIIAWMLGPVALAGSPEKVPQYVAIHATMVGVRGLVFQGLGMLIYKVSDDFIWPLGAAAVAFAWASLQMVQLERMIARRKPTEFASPGDNQL